MLTSVGRASARRVQTSRFTTSTPATTQLFCRKSAITPALPIRSFTASAWSPSPAASDKKPAKKTTSTTSTTKKAAATAIKPKSKPKSSAIETKTRPKPKAKPRSKAAVEKKPKKPKKEVDPEKLKKLEIRDIKKWTLKEKLTTLPASSWLLYTFEHRASHLGAGGLTQQATAMAEKFRQLDESEVQELARRAAINREKNVENYKAWVETYEPARIFLANKARRRLAFLTGKPQKLLTDDRLPVRPAGSYAIFMRENYASFSNPDAQEKFKDLAQAWKDMSPAEKDQYEERAAEQSIQYKAETEKLEARAKAIQNGAVGA
ncbi:hypothetical protein KAF25_001748 [Fusarium avenaceum]|uniref:HMG box domain-containing protein n=1 Tax=Fusarium avenaceum TaxID=40199 RepID=A0A9P7GUL8_9HYPO|nr:hypothetical protein KAF25_001748 [Fusarium avenaceum]